MVPNSQTLFPGWAPLLLHFWPLQSCQGLTAIAFTVLKGTAQSPLSSRPRKVSVKRVYRPDQIHPWLFSPALSCFSSRREFPQLHKTLASGSASGNPTKDTALLLLPWAGEGTLTCPGTSTLSSWPRSALRIPLGSTGGT